MKGKPNWMSYLDKSNWIAVLTRSRMPKEGDKITLSNAKIVKVKAMTGTYRKGNYGNGHYSYWGVTVKDPKYGLVWIRGSGSWGGDLSVGFYFDTITLTISGVKDNILFAKKPEGEIIRR